MRNTLQKVSIDLNHKETFRLKAFMRKRNSSFQGMHEIVQSSLSKVGYAPQLKFEPGSISSILWRSLKVDSPKLESQNPDGQRESLLKINSEKVKLPSLITAYSFYFNPAAFFDPTFILIGAGIVFVAILEKKLADNGLISIASFLSTVLRLSIPAVALGSIIYLINQASSFL